MTNDDLIEVKINNNNEYFPYIDEDFFNEACGWAFDVGVRMVVEYEKGYESGFENGHSRGYVEALRDNRI